MRTDRSKGCRAWCLQCESPEALKYCRRCGERKPLEKFHVRRDAKGASHKGWCKQCQGAYQREWRFQAKYGMTVADYDRMWMGQLGLCAICGCEPDRPLVVDHNHKTGRVRQLLCDTCNRGLGYFREKPEWIIRAAAYLIEHAA